MSGGAFYSGLCEFARDVFKCHTYLMKDKDLEKLIYQMVSRQNALMIDKIMPRLERNEDNLKAMRGEHAERIKQLEVACAELAGELYALKTGKNIQTNGSVREY